MAVFSVMRNRLVWKKPLSNKLRTESHRKHSVSIGVSGQQFHRPKGQTKAPDAEVPSFGPCKRLDYELELGIYLGKGNDLVGPSAETKLRARFNS